MASYLSSAFARIARFFSQTSQTSTLPDNIQRCTVAAGCFWGVEHVYRKEFGKKGLIDAKVGYTGGQMQNPTYNAVCGKRTGHAEALEVLFDPSKVSYRQLIEFFYRMHEPTSVNRQGGDEGPQYRSAIYFHNPEQEKIARDVTAQANAQWWDGEIVTEIAPAGKWWAAEEYHQLYLENNPGGYECPSHRVRGFAPLVEGESPEKE